MHSANKSVFFEDLALEVCPEVYEPSEDSFLFAKNLHVRADARVLDVGTGSGILAILVAKQAREVVATDINPYAIRCAKQNAKSNNVTENLAFLQGDLFEPLSETQKFDLILFNSPYLPSGLSEDQTWLGRAWAGGITGRLVIDEFIAETPPHLELTGEILLLQSTLAGVEETIAKFQAAGLKAKVAAQQSLPFFETLVLLKATF
jgi:release factor glutamine methyltransferase